MNLVGDPVELFSRTGVARQRHHAVAEAGDAEAFELAPHRDPRRGWFPGQAVHQQHPPRR
jgi:hypothetical protein